ncbi:MAG: tetratricopeptide repeat protein [Bacteroidota bacterium]
MAISIVVCNGLKAQEHTPQLAENRSLILTEEQYQQGYYKLAAQSAQQYLNDHVGVIPVKLSEDIVKAKYYLTVADLKLDIPSSDLEARKFIADTQDPAYHDDVAFNLAHYYFIHNKLTEAIPYYEMAGLNNASNQQIADGKFELAYCYFNAHKFEKANALFATMKEVPGKYYSAGNYYFGLLSYNNGDYPNALKCFQRIADEKQYHSIVPYYLAEIHYFSGDKKKALEEAQKLMSHMDKMYYDKELHLLAAQCLFEEERYNEAIPYFEYYYEHTDKIRKEELYEMAFSYYHGNDWANAIDKFKPLSNEQDSLGQTAMYLLGDCYLKTDDKKSARNAFSICAEMRFNQGQRESSLLLNAKLSYEIGFNDEAMRNVDTLLADFPHSKYRNEAKTLLSDLLIKTNNYSQAYNTIKDIKNPDENYWSVYQKVTYGYAIQQMQSVALLTADSILSTSLLHPVDKNYEAAAYFWKGEIAYKLHRYSDAIEYTDAFIKKADAAIRLHRIAPAATLQHAYLTLGYANMGNGDYTAAQNYFSTAQYADGIDSGASITARLREADATFMQKDFSKAVLLYDNAIAAKVHDTDYARFQKATLLGLLGRHTEKVSILQQLIAQTPSSPHLDNSKYELAITYIQQDKYQAAISLLQQLTGTKSSQTLAAKAWMKIGFAYQQLSNTNQAIEAYKHVVIDHPISTERAAALDALKNLYIENNQPALYGQLLREYNIPSADSNSLDSAYYAAAENQFATGKFAKALPALEQYIQRFPKGSFTTKAHYYIGEIHFLQKEYADALKEYAQILQGHWTEFTENSARRAADIAFQNGEYRNALTYYERLRGTALGNENLTLAYVGLMKTNFILNNFSNSASYADTLLTLPTLNDAARNSCFLYKAKSLQQDNKKNEALNFYKQLEMLKNSEVGCEARYNIADLYLQEDKMKDAEQAANKSIQEADGFDIWIVKSYILLADVLTKEKDYFNAKATLQSIVKNTKIADLKQEATKKLEEVKKLEKKQSKLSEE